MSRYPIYDCDNSYVLVSLKVKLRLPRAYLTLGAHRLKHRTVQRVVMVKTGTQVKYCHHRKYDVSIKSLEHPMGYFSFPGIFIIFNPQQARQTFHFFKRAG